jgi:hypothetical protein
MLLITRLTAYFRFIKNVIDYRKFLYEDRDWDYGFTLNILEIKLRRQVAFMESEDSHSYNNPITMADIKDAISILERMRTDDYTPIPDNIAEFLRLDMRITSDNILKPLTPEQDKLFTDFCRKEENAKEADWNNLWTYLNRSLRDLWD